MWYSWSYMCVLKKTKNFADECIENNETIMSYASFLSIFVSTL
jgi:hypothetical protein